MARWSLPRGAALVLEQGDLTRAAVDAVVNAANDGLLGGGGVDGAIHRAAGPDLLEACRRIPKHQGKRCPVGQARLTPGYNLAARFVIHTVGPIFRSDPDPPGHLAAAHRSSLRLAREHELQTVAFPAISCGVYGYPPEQAAPIALGVAVAEAEGFAELRFVLYSEALLSLFVDAAEALLGPPAAR